MPPLFVAHTYIDNNYVVKVKHKILKLELIFTLSGDRGFSHLFALLKAMLLFLSHLYLFRYSETRSTISVEIWGKHLYFTSCI